MDIRYLQLNTVTQEQLSLWETWLTAEKRRRLDRLPPQKRLQSLCGDALAREMLGRMLGVEPQNVMFTVNENGKPLTDGAFFSVSHSGALVACAVSDREVGLDLEQIRPVPKRLGQTLQEQWETAEDFWHLWTRREAALKCRGDALGAWKHAPDDELLCVPYPAPEGYVAAVSERK